jgi:integrase
MGKRRIAGEGSVYQRPDGYWVAAVSEGPRGHRTRRYRYAHSRRGAQEMIEKLRADLALGSIPAGRLSLADYLQKWLDDGLNVRPRTKTGYEQIVANHLTPTLGGFMLDRLTPSDVQRMVNQLASNRSPQTVRNVHACLRRAITQAVRWELINRNVAKLVVLPTVHSKPVSAMTEVEARRLLRALEEDQYRPLFVTAIATGLRLGELRGLAWSCVDLEAGTLRVEWQLDRDGPVPPKTAASRRTVQLPAYAIDVLLAHRARQHEELLAADFPTEAGFVFLSERLLPVSGFVALRHLRAACERAGLAPMRFHDLRHAFATLSLAVGVPLRVVMEALGHTTITTTANIYGHVAPEVSRRAADSMDRILLGPGGSNRGSSWPA